MMELFAPIEARQKFPPPYLPHFPFYVLPPILPVGKAVKKDLGVTEFGTKLEVAKEICFFEEGEFGARGATASIFRDKYSN